MVSSSHYVNRNYPVWAKPLLTLTHLITLSISTLGQPVDAQVCSNPSGLLIVDQSFGTAGRPAYVAGLTPYQYVPPTCPADGQFTVTETIDGSCFNYTWFAVGTDHTPDDVNGNMMIVNGANTPGVFYQQTVSGLCGGTTYEVSLWVINLLKPGICPTPLIPYLSVTIETKSGHILRSTSLGSVDLMDKPRWRRYAALFIAPKTTEELVIRLVNTTGDYGCGNDMAVDDIQVRQCDACAADQVYVPDAFTPNNDGQNDVLTFYLPNVASYNLNVYDRWGNVIFRSNDINQKWDGTYAGTPCDTGDYTWVISYRQAQTAQESVEYVQSGHVLLLR
jgi:gliding motility-associated-like protein